MNTLDMSDLIYHIDKIINVCNDDEMKLLLNIMLYDTKHADVDRGICLLRSTYRVRHKLKNWNIQYEYVLEFWSESLTGLDGT